MSMDSDKFEALASKVEGGYASRVETAAFVAEARRLHREANPNPTISKTCQVCAAPLGRHYRACVLEDRQKGHSP